MNFKLVILILVSSLMTSTLAKFERFNIDPRKYSLVLDYHDDRDAEDEKGLKENYKFKFPLIEFYTNKELNGAPVGKLNEEGLYIEGKKVCYTKNILADNYNILLEDVVLPGYLGDGDVYTVGEYSNGIKFNAIRCPFLGYRQEAGLKLMTALVLEDYDEKTKLAKIRLGDGVAYFSAKKLSLHYLHRPPLQTMDHYGVDPIEFAKHIESKFAEYLKKRRDRFKPKVSGETFEQRYGLENYFSLSNLDWMDRYGAKEYKESLIKKYGKLQIIKHFDFENMFVTASKYKNSIKGKKDIVEIYFINKNMDSYSLFKNFDNNHIRYSDFKIGFLKGYDQFKRSRGLLIPTQEYEGYPMDDF
ncbi:hypothetical protein [Halobacteriovorax sp. HLS]|uniref:hypothetical protein n=1 Tax=Halobacteriovorax sp. HLS TaxID=2234000 RepID=UPI000FD8CA2C|nr:hypothetical protein [Halobacteriovorax sp. HLS]